MNVKLLGGVFVVLLACVCAAGCVGTQPPAETAPDALVGTWVGVENGLLVSYDMTLVCNADGTAKLTGSFSGGGMSKNLNANLKWEYVSGNQYVGKSGDNSLAIYLTGDTFTITVNPMKMGIADFDIDYDINMKRSTGAAPTATPLPEGTKEIVGTWIGSKTINLFIVKASADFRVVFRADNTARVTGVLNAPGYDNVPFDREITWSYLGSGRYRGAYGSTSIIFVVKGDVMTMTVNPYKLGLTDNKILDMDIDAELRKTAF